MSAGNKLYTEVGISTSTNKEEENFQCNSCYMYAYKNVGKTTNM